MFSVSKLPFKETQTMMSAFFCLCSKLTTRPGAIAVVMLLPALVPSVRAQSVGYKKPEVHLKGVAVEGVDWSKRTAETKLSIEVENTGPAFKLKELSYRLNLNDK